MIRQNPPKAVLFACQYNAIRSPIAQGLMRLLYKDTIYVASCGVSPRSLDPLAAIVMEEIGVSIAHHIPKSFDDLDDLSFDLMVSLAPQAHHQALLFTKTFAIEAEYWPTPDPSIEWGSREQKLLAYRLLRDQLFQKIQTRFGSPKP